MSASRTFAALAVLFAVSAALPFVCCVSMAKAEMEICGQATLAS